LDSLGNALSEIPGAIVRGPYAELDGSWLFRVLVWPLSEPLYSLFGYDVSGELMKRVDTFHPTKWVVGSEALTICLVTTITLAFGGIHCIAWSFPFPSSTERTLWRVAALSITSVPIAIFPILILEDVIDDYDILQFGDSCKFMIFILLAFLYLLGRLVLLGLPLLSLRSLPSAAFHVVQWTSFIPHV